MLCNRNFSHPGLVWKIGNGNKIPFCLDNYCATKSLCHMMGLADSSQDADLKVAQFITPDKTRDVAQTLRVPACTSNCKGLHSFYTG